MAVWRFHLLVCAMLVVVCCFFVLQPGHSPWHHIVGTTPPGFHYNNREADSLTHKESEEQTRRKKRIEDICTQDPELTFDTTDNMYEESMLRFIVNEDNNLLYCGVPKVGSSFWKRAFTIMEGKNKGKALFNMSGRAIHRIRGAYQEFQTVFQNVAFAQVYRFVHSATKFIFVRDPYERLYSGFIDRLFAMTETLNNLAPKLYKLGVRNSMAANHTRVVQQNSKCKRGVNSTFIDFIHYVTISGPIKVDIHFVPTYGLCVPCLINFDYIGKMETFHDDASSILTSAGMNPEDIFGSDSKFEENSDVSILRDVSVRVFQMFGMFKKCFTRFQMLRRTWVTLQIRGFLSVEHPFPLSQTEAQTVTRERFQQLVFDAYKDSGPRDVIKKQRHLAVVEAFSGLPDKLLKDVEEFVEKDCRLFGYECSVEQRFRPAPAKKLFNIEGL